MKQFSYYCAIIKNKQYNFLFLNTIIMERNKKCSVCENDFIAQSNKAKYCSNACRLTAFRKREKSKTTSIINEIQSDLFYKPNFQEQRIEAIELKQDELYNQFVEITTYIAENLGSIDKLKYMVEYQKEYISEVKRLTNTVEELKTENNCLRNEINQIKDVAANITYEVKGIKQELKGVLRSTNNQSEISFEEKIAPIFAGLIAKI